MARRFLAAGTLLAALAVAAPPASAHHGNGHQTGRPTNTGCTAGLTNAQGNVTNPTAKTALAQALTHCKAQQAARTNRSR